MYIQIIYQLPLDMLIDVDALPKICHKEFDLSYSFCPICGRSNNIPKVWPIKDNGYFSSCSNDSITFIKLSSNASIDIVTPADLRFLKRWACRKQLGQVSLEVLIYESQDEAIWNDGEKSLKPFKEALGRNNIEWNDKYCKIQINDRRPGVSKLIILP